MAVGLNGQFGPYVELIVDVIAADNVILLRLNMEGNIVKEMILHPRIAMTGCAEVSSIK